MSSIIELIERYITPEWKHSGNNNIGIKCPFHKGGNESRASFFINTENGLYFCHTCHIGGTVPRLLNDLGVPKHVIDVETSDLRASIEYENTKKKIITENKFKGDPYKADPILSETVLLNYKDIPTQLVEAGFSTNWLRFMEIGIDHQNNRIIYPIRDVYGNLAGVSGGRMFEEQLPKYKVYSGGYRESHTGLYVPSLFGSWFDTQYPAYEFKKGNFLWNFDRVYARLFHKREQECLYVVEGFKACLWMLQNGYPNTIALMGSNMTEAQYGLITRLSSDIVLFLDNDEAGIKCTRYMGSLLKKHGNIFYVEYPLDKKQPDDFSKGELDGVLDNKKMITVKDLIKWKHYRGDYTYATLYTRAKGD